MAEFLEVAQISTPITVAKTRHAGLGSIIDTDRQFFLVCVEGARNLLDWKNG